MSYTLLKAAPVIETIEKLEARIGARFPAAGLRSVCQSLQETARRCAAEADRLNQPAIPLRLSVYAIWTLGAAALAFLLGSIRYAEVELEAVRLVQVLEPAMNIAVLVGIGVAALGQLETRLKRARALDYLHELRSIAHVVDMHQLTKDPYRSAPNALPATEFSPKEILPPALLERYLDYCAELLSLTGKLAALLAQSCKDAVVIDAASDVETLTTGLAQKIAQKTTLLSRLIDPPGAPAGRLGENRVASSPV
jgi:hypothetical protein